MQCSEAAIDVLQMWICLVLNLSPCQQLTVLQLAPLVAMCLACQFLAHFHQFHHLIKKWLTCRYCILQCVSVCVYCASAKLAVVSHWPTMFVHLYVCVFMCF